MITAFKFIRLLALISGFFLNVIIFAQNEQKSTQSNIPTVPPCEDCGGGGGGTPIIEIGAPQLQLVNSTTLNFKCSLFTSNIDTSSTIFTWNWKVNNIVRSFNAKASLVSQNWQQLDLSGLGIAQPNTYNFSLEVVSGSLTTGVDDYLTTFEYIHTPPTLTVNASASGTVGPTIRTVTFDFTGQTGGAAFYKYSTNAGQSWSTATSVATPLVLDNLGSGDHRVDFIGGWTSTSSASNNWMSAANAVIKTWTIQAPTMTLLSPNGAEILGKNLKTLVTWNSNILNSGTVNIVLYRQTSSSNVKNADSKKNSDAIAGQTNEAPGSGTVFTSTVLMYNTSNDGSELVTIPASIMDEFTEVYVPDANDFRIRVESSLGAQDISDANISVVTSVASFSLTTPIEVDQAATLNFSWNKNISEPVGLTLSGGQTYTIRANTNTSNSGNESFPLSSVANGQYRIIMATAYETIVTSAWINVSQPKITMVSPIGGTFVRGVNLPIRWTGNISGNVKIEILENGTPIDGYITTSTPHDGIFDWTIPGTFTPGSYQIKITGLTTGIFVTSDPFIVESGLINVISPSDGYVTSDGSRVYVQFQTNLTGHVKIDLYRFSTVTNAYQLITPAIASSFDLPPIENCASYLPPQLYINQATQRSGAAIRSEVEGGGGGTGGGGTGSTSQPAIELRSLCLRVNTPKSVTFSGVLAGLFATAHPDDGLSVTWTLRRDANIIQTGTISLSANQLSAGHTLTFTDEMIVSAGYNMTLRFNGSGYSFPSTSLSVSFSNNPYEYRNYLHTWDINNPGLLNSTRYKIRITSIENGTVYSETPDFTITDKYNSITSETILLDKIYTDSQIDTLSDQNLQRVTVYTDGMGRLRQTVAYKGSTSKKDVISPVEYDRFGKVSKSYLPYVASTADGLFRKDWKTAQAAFYQGPPEGIAQTSAPYAVTKFENSSLSRPLEHGAPGEDWQPHPDDYDGHTIKVIERANYENEVHKWHADGTDDGWYPAGEIMVREMRDENGTPSWSYTDKSANVLLKKSIKGSEDVLTYYVYDDFGQLKFIIPPMGVKEILATASPIGSQAVRTQDLSASAQYASGLPTQTQSNINLAENEGGGISGGPLAFTSELQSAVVIQDAFNGRLTTYVNGGGTTQGTLFECRWKIGADGSVQTFRATRMDFQQGTVFTGLNNLGLTKGQTYAMYIELRTMTDEPGGVQTTGWSPAINMIYDFDVPVNWNITQTLKDKWVTEFFYDELGRLIEKKIPEAASLYTVYDALGRVALTQDGKLRENDQWMFSKWDDKGRTIISGIYTDHTRTTRAAMQAFVNNGGVETTYQSLTAHLETEALGYSTEGNIFNPLWNFNYVSPLIYFKPGDVTSATVQVSHAMRGDPQDATPLCSYTMGMEYRISVNGTWPTAWTPISGNMATFTLSGNQDGIAVRQTTLTIQGGAGCQTGKVFLTMDVTAQQPVYNMSNVSFYEKRTPDNFSQQHGYTNSSFPDLNQCEVWTITYYDDYDFNNDGNPDVVYTEDSEFPDTRFDRIRGAVTGSKVRILNPSGSGNVFSGNGTYTTNPSTLSPLYLTGEEITLNPEFQTYDGQEVQIGPANPGSPMPGVSAAMPQWLTSVTYFDKYGRAIQTYSNNELSGSDISNMFYSFDGKLIYNKLTHQTPYDVNVIRNRHLYDHLGRHIVSYQKNNSITDSILTKATVFGDLGSIAINKLHSNDNGNSFLQLVNYTYNARGWLTSINDVDNIGSDIFAMKLNYNTLENGLNQETELQFNGNIVSQIWRMKNGSKHGFAYGYDKMNQLTYAKYIRNSATFWDGDENRYNEQISYDLNGNIKTLKRHGKTSYSNQPTYGLMDDLDYNYVGNKLFNLNDAIADIPQNNKHDFSDNSYETTFDALNTGTFEYVYDINGNIIADHNKGITQIEYNLLNLPTKIEFGSDHLNRLEWTYTSTGVKIEKRVYVNGTLSLTQDYVSGFVYKNGTLDYFTSTSGRVKKLADGNLQYQYDMTDHLGNTRAMFTTGDQGQAILLEESHYYAFGLRIQDLSSQNPDNKLTYNGKELEDDFGLNWYHYGARFYDPTIGKWKQLDPVQEYHSPYMYVGNMPIMAYDPTGKDTWLVHGWNSSPDLCFPPLIGIRKIWAGIFREGEDQLHMKGWSGVSDRLEINLGAQQLAKDIEEAYIKSGRTMKINIVAHSEGGLVAIQAANILASRKIKVDNLVTLNTPSRLEFPLFEDAMPDKFVMAYSKYDFVTNFFGGNTLKGAVPFEISKWIRGGKHHTDAPENPEIAKHIGFLLDILPSKSFKFHFDK